jgi:hypothetical protein
MGSPPDEPLLCCVRLTRGGPVWFVDSAGHDVVPGQSVIIEGNDGVRIAAVAIGSGQVVENEGRVSPDGRVVRVADQADIVVFGQRTAEELGIAARARERCWEAGAEIVAAWVAPDGAWATITLARAVAQPDALARDLVALLGIAVALAAPEDDGVIRPISGVAGAGLPKERVEWLVPPGAAPELRISVDEHGESSAGAFIARLFPSDENWPAPRTERRRKRRYEQE